MAKSQMQSRWSPGPLGWLTLSLLAAVMGLWTWVDAQEAAPMLELPSQHTAVNQGVAWQDALDARSSASRRPSQHTEMHRGKAWQQQMADSLAERSARASTPEPDPESDPATVKHSPFEIYHNGKLVGRPLQETASPRPLPEPRLLPQPKPVLEDLRPELEPLPTLPQPKPLPEPRPLPKPTPGPDLEPEPEVTELPPAPKALRRVRRDLRESVAEPAFEPEPAVPAPDHLPAPRSLLAPPTLPAPHELNPEDKATAVQLLHQARELAEQGSFESATWLVLRAQQLASWNEDDDLRPDQVLAEIQAIQMERAETVTPTSATSPGLEETASDPGHAEPRDVDVQEPATTEQKLAQPEPQRDAHQPIIIQMPAAPAPIVTQTSLDDLVIPVGVGSLVVGCMLITFMACGGVVVGLMQRMTRSTGPITYRLELAGKEGTSLLGPIQIIDNRPAVAPVMMGMPMSVPMTAPAAPTQKDDAEEEIDPRTLDVPDPMLLPFNMGPTFAEEQAQREAEEQQRETDLIKHIFDKNVELQDELEKLDNEEAA